MENFRIKVDGNEIFVLAADLASYCNHKNTAQFCRQKFPNSFVRKGKYLYIKKSNVVDFMVKKDIESSSQVDHSLCEKRIDNLKEEFRKEIERLEKDVNELHRTFRQYTRVFRYHQNVLEVIYYWIMKKAPSLKDEEIPLFPHNIQTCLDNIKLAYERGIKRGEYLTVDY